MKTAIGQDSHRFEKENSKKVCILGGVTFPEVPGLLANSDGDVVLHAITNAISGITCHNILGEPADRMCESGITDSSEYLKVALGELAALSLEISHVSISIEGARPKISPRITEMRESISGLLDISPQSVGITATTGEGLTEFGKGSGISVFCVLTVE
ncbi:MAG: 2-C-methyl-D-erythritol 2,4-cyclodiphosphate synthase [Lachnospiraceae bacterium]|nr:2-C-methyl-D-erythritol 2,4-cyclodiphosphate synthase [Lachnospiraceae bacterium]